MFLVREGNIYKFKNVRQENVKQLPPHIFLLQEDGSLHFRAEKFSIPEKLYGNVLQTAERYVNTFNSTEEKSVGVLLSGLRGSGKTIMAKVMADKTALPIIIVQKYFENLFEVLSQLTQEVVVLIDEFEKIYNTEEKQNDLLPILDGVFSFKKFFIFTSNSHSVNKFLLNRPSRIRYHKYFGGLSREEIQEIAEDLVENKENIDDLISISDILGEIAMDSLLSVINEMNLYNESARSTIEHLNIKTETFMYDVILLINHSRYTTVFRGHPLQGDSITLYYKKDENSWYEESFVFKPEQYTMMSPEMGKMEFTSEDGVNKIVFTKKEKEKKLVF